MQTLMCVHFFSSMFRSDSLCRELSPASYNPRQRQLTSIIQLQRRRKTFCAVEAAHLALEPPSYSPSPTGPKIQPAKECSGFQGMEEQARAPSRTQPAKSSTCGPHPGWRWVAISSARASSLRPDRRQQSSGPLYANLPSNRRPFESR